MNRYRSLKTSKAPLESYD